MKAILEERLYLESELYRLFQQDPLHFIDIGARGGVHSLVSPMADMTAVLAFEPDPKAAAELRVDGAGRWKHFLVEETAIGAHNGTADLHLYAHGVNHSLLPASDPFRTRYQVASLADRGVIPVNVETLDSVLFGRLGYAPLWGEFLKLDIQGMELDLLRASPRTLRERTVAIVAEISFLDIYKDQPRFSHLERFLAEQGFTFYGFLNLQGWSCKYIDKRQSVGRERLCFGDAIFLRDPLPSGEGSGPLSARQSAVLYMAALLLGYYDFAVELATSDDLEMSEAERRIALARKLAHTPPRDAIAEVQALLERMQHSPEDANIELGRFLDKRRTTFDVSDAALPRVQPVPKACR